MVTEEKDLKSQIEQRVVDFTSKINVLTEELGLPKFQVSFVCSQTPVYFSVIVS